MEEFDTFEKVLKIFGNLNCVGNENCIFLSYVDRTTEAYVGGALGVLASTAVGLDNFAEYTGFLVNQTENGIGFVPFAGGMLSLKGVKLLPEKFFFVQNQEIENITVKNFTLFNKNVQAVKIKITNGKTIKITANIKLNGIPYQEVNFSKFVNKYKK